MAQKRSIIISDPHNLVATGGFDGLSPPQTKLHQYQSVEFLLNFQNVKPPCTHERPRYWWLSGDGSGPAVCRPGASFFTTTSLNFTSTSFLPRTVEDSATAIWIYLYTQCDSVIEADPVSKVREGAFSNIW